MRDENEQPTADLTDGTPLDPESALQTRRAMLRIGALGATAIVTVRPGIAQAALQSALTCSIPLPLAADAGKLVDKNGAVYKKAPNGTQTWAFPSQPLNGEDVKNAIKYNTTIPGTVADQTTGYRKYIEANITSGKPGYTCYASLQSPHRY